MSLPRENTPIEIGNPGVDRLLNDAGEIGDSIRKQAKGLAALSHAALVAIESPVPDTVHFPGGWPLTSAPDLEELLLAKAEASIHSEKKSRSNDEDPVTLEQFMLSKHTYYEPEMRGTYVSYGDVSAGYPPTGLAHDLIKWSSELAQSGWSVLTQLDRASSSLAHYQFDVYVYSENGQTKELLDQQTTVQEEYKASKWLSKRVLMYAYSDEFDRFDWTGQGVPREQVAVR